MVMDVFWNSSAEQGDVIWKSGFAVELFEGLLGK